MNALRQTVYALILAACVGGAFVGSQGCATNPRHQLAVSSQVVASSLFATQDAEEAAYLVRKCATPPKPGCISLDAHQRFNQHLVVALETGRAFTVAVRAWDHGQPFPEELAKLKVALFNLTAEVTAGYPEDVRAQLLATMASTYDAILAVLAAAGQ